jgi:type IV pilus assembly protein PilA
MRRKLTPRGQEYKVKQLASGFTLIELMIAVAIVGFLSMIALPAFQDYAVRSKMTEVILALSSCRAPISETYQAGVATLPGPNGWGCELGTTQGTRYVAALSTSADGMITATVQNISAQVNTSVVTLAPLANATTLATMAADSPQKLYGWRCGSGADGTNVPLKYLPGSCRG